MSSGETTTDHDVIREWAETRGGRPTRVKGTESRDGSGVLRFDFNEPEDKLEEISWEEFFETFDDRELAFLYQDKTADGHTSRFFKFVHRREGDEDGSEHPATGKPHGGSHSRSQHEEPSRGKDGEKDAHMASNTHHSGSVKDPEHDGRLKENREAGRTKGTTSGSEARAREHGNDTEEHGGRGKSGGSHSTASHATVSHSKGSQSSKQSEGGSDDLKSREYTDAQGNVHHHTRTYQEQHGKE